MLRAETRALQADKETSIATEDVGGAIAGSTGGFFFIRILLTLGVTALFSVVLSARGLWERSPGTLAAQRG